MHLVTVYDELDDTKKEHRLPNLAAANDFLYKAGFSYDSLQDETYLWCLDEFRYGTIEEIDK